MTCQNAKNILLLLFACCFPALAWTAEESIVAIREPSAVSGVKDQALRFTSINGNGCIAFFKNAPKPFIYGSSGTIALWFKHEEAPSPKESLVNLLSHYDGMRNSFDNILPGRDELSVYLSKVKQENAAEASKMELHVSGSIGGKGFHTMAAAVIGNDEWHHMSIVWQPGTLTLYVDGKSVGKIAIPEENEFALTEYFTLSGELYDFTYGFRGSLDEVMTFSRALAAEEVGSLAKGGDFSADKSLGFYMPCDGNALAKVERKSLGEAIAGKPVFRATLGNWQYAASGDPIKMCLSLPSGAKEDFDVKISIISSDDGKTVFQSEEHVQRDDGKPLEKSFSTSIERCDMYNLSLDVKDSKGKSVLSRKTPFAVTVKLPPLSEIPDSSPCGDESFPLQSIGAKWIRLHTSYSWAALEPRKNQFHWSFLDASVATVKANGGKAMLCVGHTPKWASSMPVQKKPEDNAAKDELSQMLNVGSSGSYPPKDMADFENFLRHLFQRYKGKIAAYQLWNEPNSDQFTGGAIKYTALLNVMRKILSEEDPSAILVGFSGCPGYGIWTEAVTNAGGAPFIDVLSVHDYCYSDPISWYKRGELTKAKNCVEKAVGHPIPVWSDEMGTVPVNLTKEAFIKKYGAETTSIVGVVGTYKTQSICWDIQSALTILMAGNSNKYFWNGTNQARLSSKGVAFAALAKAVSFRKTITPIDTGNDKSLGALIENIDGSRTAALFSSGSSMSFFPSKNASVKGMDMYGNPIEFKTEDGLLKLALTSETIYLFGVPADFKGICVASVSGLPKNSKAEQKLSCEMTLANPYGQKERFSVAVKSPEGWRVELPSTTIELEANSKTTLPLDVLTGTKTGNSELEFIATDSKGNSFPAKRDIYNLALLPLHEITAPIVLADETSWRSIETLEEVDGLDHVKIGLKNPMFPNLAHWTGPKDLSYKVKGGWRADGLYLWIEITDDKLFPGKPDAPWNRDAVELFVDFVSQGKIAGGRARTEQIAVIPSLSSEFAPCKLKYCNDGTFAKAEFYGRKTENGYIVAGNLAYGSPQPGWTVGLDVIIDDCDDPEAKETRKTAMAWHGDQWDCSDSLKWGRYRLIQAPEARLDVSSDSELKFLSGSMQGENPPWMKGAQAKYLYTHAPVSSVFQDFSVSFVSSESGVVNLQFMGNWAQNKADMPSIDFSTVLIEGATFKGQPFESSFTAAHEKRCARGLLVKGGTPVKVSFKARIPEAVKSSDEK